MQRILTLYNSYDECRLDLSIFGQLVSTPTQSVSELKDSLHKEFQKRKPFPSLESRRYELGELAETVESVTYAEELDLQDNEELFDLRGGIKRPPKPASVEDEPLEIPSQAIKDFFTYQSRVTDSIRDEVIGQYDMVTGEDLPDEFKLGVATAESIVGAGALTDDTVLSDEQIADLGADVNNFDDTLGEEEVSEYANFEELRDPDDDEGNDSLVSDDAFEDFEDEWDEGSSEDEWDEGSSEDEWDGDSAENVQDTIEEHENTDQGVVDTDDSDSGWPEQEDGEEAPGTEASEGWYEQEDEWGTQDTEVSDDSDADGFDDYTAWDESEDEQQDSQESVYPTQVEASQEEGYSSEGELSYVAYPENSDDDVWDETTWEDSEDEFTETTEPEGDITEDSDQEDDVWEDLDQEDSDWEDSDQGDSGWDDSYSEDGDWDNPDQEDNGWDNPNQGDDGWDDSDQKDDVWEDSDQEDSGWDDSDQEDSGWDDSYSEDAWDDLDQEGTWEESDQEGTWNESESEDSAEDWEDPIENEAPNNSGIAFEQPLGQEGVQSPRDVAPSDPPQYNIDVAPPAEEDFFIPSEEPTVRHTPPTQVQPMRSESPVTQPPPPQESEPTDLRHFLRKYPNSEISFVLQYFTKKQVEQAIKTGKIAKRGSTLRLA